MVDGTTAIRRSTVLTDMLNAPVAELAMGDDVDVCEDFFDAGSLWYH